MRLRLMLAGLAVVAASVLTGCSGDSAATAGDPAKQIDSKATPTLPAPTSSVGGAASGSAPAATPQ